MKNLGRFRFPTLVALGAVLGGCGSSQPPPTHDRPRTNGPHHDGDGGGGGSPWDELTPEALSKVVSDGVGTRVHDAQPDFDMAKIADYRGAPDSAPMIGGRAARALLDLAVVDLVAGRHEDAEKTVRLVRARAKNRNATFTGVDILAEAKRRAAGVDRDAQQAAIEGVLGELPRMRLDTATVLYDRYRNMDQVLAEITELRAQRVSPETAGKVLYLSQVLTTIVNERQTYLHAIEAVRLGHQSDPPRQRFAFSTADVSKRKAAKIVRVGVWDLGVEPSAFEGSVFFAMERENGQDDDGDGVADNDHGVVFDGNAPQKALLFDPGADVLGQYAAKMRGISDFRVGIGDSDDAQQLIEMRQSVSDAEALAALDRSLDAVFEWGHGTAVASTVLAGNPKAKLSIFRSSWMGRRAYPGRGPTDEELAAERRNMEQVAKFLKKNEITVVCVGIDVSPASIEEDLRKAPGAFENDEALRARVRQIQTYRTESWQGVFRAAPGTLFVVAAGDDDVDVSEYETLPASLDAPNVIAAGAIDQYGDWAVFTNSGDRVRLFDLGVEVEAKLPNGETTRLSGTAFAAANVANLAGKMMSLNSTLMPDQVIEIMRANTVELSAPFAGKVAHEQRCVDAAWSARGRRRPPAQ
jgi:hypothetical protein